MPARRPGPFALAISLGALAIAAIGVALAARHAASAPPRFVGSSACARCHAAEYAAWKGSQHAQAMQDATPATVLGRFDGRSFTNANVTYRFFRRGDTSIVNAIGADGAPHDYPVRYTFGVAPLQQYLIALPNGRVQALLVAWDDRPAAQGGQHWFSLSPGNEASHTDPFHWTGREYNWNYMCADCHSTAVRKQYDAAKDAFHTRFAEINVSCEACHGPASSHASWAKYPAFIRRVLWPNDPLPAKLTERRGVTWTIDTASGNAHRSAPRTTDREIETCAQCHARRNHFADGYTAGKRLMDYYTPLPIISPLYYPDGQQHDEVYKYASFLESKMYSMGVTCSDCHDPHTGKTRAPGNAVCLQCHLAAKYDTPTHHFHQANTPGAQCVSCHMPDTTYMQIDARHDHSIRIPRPDLSVTLGVPNACNRCHTDKSASWAAAQLRGWYPHPNPGFQRFTMAFAADDRGAPGATDSLGAVANDPSEPWMVRASALARLAAHPSAVALQASAKWATDPNPVVRLYALQILESAPAADRIAIAGPLLGDPLRGVRQEAAWLVAPFADSLTTAAQKQAFASAAAEFVDSQRYNADRPQSRLTLATFYAELGQLDSAAVEFHGAARLDSAQADRFAQALAAAAPSNAQAAAFLRAISGAP
ncbi:MAG TPA: multiheme c-type cytochrome [Gemmatimonadaceae bacterium]|nr:multiheme c-type cytochrome [Gemmatimonadaceae bacterium]